MRETQHLERKAATRAPASLGERGTLQGIRPRTEVLAEVGKFLRLPAGDRPPNWHLDIVLEDVRRVFAARYGAALPATPTAHAAFLRQASRAVIAGMVGASPDLKRNTRAVILYGPAAHGYAPTHHVWVAGRALPLQTLKLVGTIYTWLFASLGKSADLHNVRFLDEDLTSVLAPAFLLVDPSVAARQELAERVRAEFVERFNFSPPVRISVEPAERLSLERVLSGYCVHGLAYVAGELSGGGDRSEGGDFYAHFHQAVQNIVAELSAPQLRAWIKQQSAAPDGEEAIASYLRVQEEPNTPLSLDLISPDRQGGDWLEKNRRFFHHIRQGRFDSLLVADITKELGDRKGLEKENPFTILEVSGLKDGDDLIPASDVVLKLRGLSHYRGDINNQLDLIKEYASYAYIHNRLSAPAPYVLGAGPLLLSCERLAVPFDRQETRNWIGIFLEALAPPGGARLLTCRVRRLSDFWALGDSLRRVLRAAKAHGIQVDVQDLKARLRALAAWLWSEAICVDYCDLVLSIDEAGRVASLRLIDLERLSFSELVNEYHVILDTLVDLKTHLGKRDWYTVLAKAYVSKDSSGGLGAFSELRAYLKPRGRKRALAIRGLHATERALRLLGPSLGRSVWRRFVRTLVALSALVLRATGS